MRQACHLAVASAAACIMQFSRGEKSGTVIEFSGQAGSAPTNGTTVPSGIPSQKRTLLEAGAAMGHGG